MKSLWLEVFVGCLAACPSIAGVGVADAGGSAIAPATTRSRAVDSEGITVSAKQHDDPIDAHVGLRPLAFVDCGPDHRCGTADDVEHGPDKVGPRSPR